MPTISVIVPVYNVEKYLVRCVDSILAQTYTDFKLLLVDDGSTDRSGEICDEYAVEDERITVIHQKNTGAAGARNTGIDYTINNLDCKWICFIDSDDYIHHQYLELMLYSIKHNSESLIACKWCREDIDDSYLDKKKLIFKIMESEKYYCELNVDAVVPWGKMISVDCFTNLRFPTGKLHEDEFVTYQLIFRNSQIVYIDVPLYSYSNNMNSVMHLNWTPRQMDYFEAVSQQISFFEKNNYSKALDNAVFWFARVLCEQMESVSDSKEYREYYLKMQKMFRVFLKKYGKKYLPIKENNKYYEYAFPKRMKIYWDVKGIMGKIKNA